MGILFGTDGVRGIANTELTPELAFKLGRYGAHVLTGHLSHKPRIIVGRDTRISGDMLESALVAGILSAGAHADVLGVVPTPAVSYLTRKYNADAGVVISASHNSAQYNGIKFFNADGFKLSDAMEDEIETYVLGQKEMEEIPWGANIGRKTRMPSDAEEDYVAFAISTAPCSLSGLKVAVDCANGAAYRVATQALTRLGAEISIIFNDPDGININEDCGSTHTKRLKSFVVETGSDIGIAFDGDADRLIAIDETGKTINGDTIMGLCAMQLKEKGNLKGALVATVMSNLGLSLACEQQEIEVVQAKVGDRYVLEEMVARGCNLGGEQSGHIIFLDYNTTGDGLITAIQLLCMLKEKGMPASQMAKRISILPQVLVNVKIQNKYKESMMLDPEVAAFISRLDRKYDGTGRVLVRPSGTEPLVRIMIEGQDKDEMKEDAYNLGQLLENKFGQ